MKKCSVLAAVLWLAAATAFAADGKGYAGSVETGYGVGTGHYKMNHVNVVHLVNGYRFCPYFSAGIGLGLNYHDAMWYGRKTDFEEWTVPVYLRLQADLTDRNVVPFVSMDAGYNIPTEKHAFVRGLLLSPAVGVSFRLRANPRVSFYCKAGYALHRLKLRPPLADGLSRRADAIDVRLGFSF